jgi:hypothetical protein
MQPMYYVCITSDSRRRSISATRLELDHWIRSLPQPWSAAMEATMSRDSL